MFVKCNFDVDIVIMYINFYNEFWVLRTLVGNEH